MILSFLVYIGIAVALAGLVSVARPITSLRIRHRWVAALVFALGAVLTLVAITQPGFAKVTMNFLIQPRGERACVLRTETRVLATDPSSRAMFTHYWRMIAPGSALIRKMWLRAIKVRAEAPVRSPTPTRPSA